LPGFQLIVFSPGAAEFAEPARLPPLTQIEVAGDWEFELQPTLDNRFGDYHWPPTPTLIGAEVRQLEYAEVEAGPWRKVTCSFGPQFWKLGPVARVQNESSLKPDAHWTPYEFSWRWGIEGDPGHQGYHGLKEQVHDEFIALGTMRLKAWVDGKELAVKAGRIEVTEPSAKLVPVLLRIEQDCGCYAGAALPEPIRLECAAGQITPGDWSKIDGLLSYSGSAWYRKTVEIPPADRVILDLGDVAATAEVRVNGQVAPVRVSPPWCVDITKLAKPGENRITILVHNTLANHYTTIPTRYRGPTTSGLLGPVRLRLQNPGR